MFRGPFAVSIMKILSSHMWLGCDHIRSYFELLSIVTISGHFPVSALVSLHIGMSISSWVHEPSCVHSFIASSYLSYIMPVFYIYWFTHMWDMSTNVYLSINPVLSAQSLAFRMWLHVMSVWLIDDSSKNPALIHIAKKSVPVKVAEKAQATKSNYHNF